MTSKENQFIDGLIEKTLAACFEERQAKGRSFLALEVAREKFFDFSSSQVTFFGKVKLLEQAYERKLALMTDGVKHVLDVPVPSSTTLALLYYDLVDNSLFDPSVTRYAFDNKTAVGNMPPELYVVCYLLAMSATRRSFNDGTIAPVLCGGNSTGKSTCLDPFTNICKVVANDAEGVGRYQMSDTQYAIYFNDALYANLTTKSESQIVKNLLRGEPCTVKIRNKTVPLVNAAWCIMATNENLFLYKHPTKNGYIREPKYQKARQIEEHFRALKARLLEVLFLKPGPKVNANVFSHRIPLREARAGLAALALVKMKHLQHPIRVGSPLLMMSVLEAMHQSKDLVPKLLDMTLERYEALLFSYGTIYAIKTDEDLKMSPKSYDAM